MRQLTASEASNKRMQAQLLDMLQRNKREASAIDMLHEYNMRQEDARLNQIRSFYRARNYGW